MLDLPFVLSFVALPLAQPFQFHQKEFSPLEKQHSGISNAKMSHELETVRGKMESRSQAFVKLSHNVCLIRSQSTMKSCQGRLRRVFSP